MRSGSEVAQVGYAKVGNGRAEHAAAPRAGGHRCQCGPAARRAAADGQPGRVGAGRFRHPPRSSDGVLHVHDAPLAAQPLPVLAAVAGGAAVVHVDDPDAAAGEVRLAQVEDSGGARGGAAVHPDDERRPLASRASDIRIGRRVQQRMDDLAIRALEVHLLRHWQVRRVGQLGRVVQNLSLARRGVDPDDGGPGRRPAADRRDRPPSADRSKANSANGVSRSLSSNDSGSRMPSLAGPAPCATARRPSPSSANGRAPSCQSGPGELLVSREQGQRRLASQADLVDVPPAWPVGRHVEAGIVPPQRCQHRLPLAAHQRPAFRRHTVLDRGDPQFRAVPGHVRMVPADPGQPFPVRRRRREGEEVEAVDQRPDGLGLVGRRAVQRHSHDRAGDLSGGMPFLHAPDLPAGLATGRSRRTGGPRRAACCRSARAAGTAAGSGVSGVGSASPGSGQVEPLVGVVGEQDLVAAGGRPPARSRQTGMGR